MPPGAAPSPQLFFSVGYVFRRRGAMWLNRAFRPQGPRAWAPGDAAPSWPGPSPPRASALARTRPAGTRRSLVRAPPRRGATKAAEARHGGVELVCNMWASPHLHLRSDRTSARVSLKTLENNSTLASPSSGDSLESAPRARAAPSDNARSTVAHACRTCMYMCRPRPRTPPNLNGRGDLTTIYSSNKKFTSALNLSSRRPACGHNSHVDRRAATRSGSVAAGGSKRPRGQWFFTRSDFCVCF